MSTTPAGLILKFQYPYFCINPMDERAIGLLTGVFYPWYVAWCLAGYNSVFSGRVNLEHILSRISVVSMIWSRIRNGIRIQNRDSAGRIRRSGSGSGSVPKHHGSIRLAKTWTCLGGGCSDPGGKESPGACTADWDTLQVPYGSGTPKNAGKPDIRVEKVPVPGRD